MIQVKSFCFNSFDENTYILYDETGECIIIDPGCHLPAEEKELAAFIENKGLKVVRLINTHCHIDHILGNSYVAGKYRLDLEIHELELKVLESSLYVSKAYQIQFTPSPAPKKFIRESDEIKFGNSTLKVIFTPGHSPGSITFYNKEQGIIISGDVIFERSIGRTDLPGGDYDTLMDSITNKLLPLGDDVKIYPGHGNPTTIGSEKKMNPFLREHFQN